MKGLHMAYIPGDIDCHRENKEQRKLEYYCKSCEHVELADNASYCVYVSETTTYSSKDKTQARAFSMHLSMHPYTHATMHERHLWIHARTRAMEMMLHQRSAMLTRLRSEYLLNLTNITTTDF